MDWEKEWERAQAQAMLSKCRVGKADFCGYFNRIAGDYLKEALADEPFYRGIVGFLESEGYFREGEDVLDIACGPGTYTLHFAERARSVAALDPAEGMLSVLMQEAERRGLSNIRPMRSRWEEHDGDERYDLVFTALSPGITGPATFLKMERYSKRSCCYIGFGDVSNNELSDELWELIMGESRKSRGFSIGYPFNVLLSKGRKPNVRYCKSERTSSEPCDEVIKSNLDWLGMFTAVDRGKEKKVRDHVLARSRNGFYAHIARQSLVALYWDVT
ncbi:MAG TPA: class I SAM-dependent methyltransferase [Methanocella sp.]|nr:class I SAM-dependent methyltransferase [Methanocella sp.]